MTPIRQAIVDAARSEIGTKFQHQARLPGVRLDCVGLLIVVARQLGLVEPDFDVNGYPAAADGVSLMGHLDRLLVRRGTGLPGDIGVYSWGIHEHHVGILVPYRHGQDKLAIVHAHGPASPSCVVESRLLPNMRQRAIFAFPGVTD